MMTSKAYSEATADDFKALFAARFPGGDPRIPDLVLMNPARTGGSDAGSIAYDEQGAVVAIHGLFPRRLFCGRQPMKATSGVALAVRKDANRDFLNDFLHDSVLASGADLFFANTSVPGSRKRGAEVLNMQDGPASCSEIRERSLRGDGWLAKVSRKMHAVLGLLHGHAGPLLSAEESFTRGEWTLTRVCRIDDRDFDDFWSRYLDGNVGLVSSRTAEELQWMFGEDLASGEVVLLTARKNDDLQGYVFCRRTDETAACWRVVDLIALANDETTLSALVEGAGDFLRRRTPATCLQITGFPMWVQPLFRRLFPSSSSFGFNKCTWICLSDQAKVQCANWVNAQDGWYGGPYDGDMCLS